MPASMRSYLQRPIDRIHGLSARRERQAMRQGADRYFFRLSSGCLMLVVAMQTGCCSTGYLTLRTLACEPAHFCFKIDRIRSKSLYREWAEREWQQNARGCAGGHPSPDYE